MDTKVRPLRTTLSKPAQQNCIVNPSYDCTALSATILHLWNLPHVTSSLLFETYVFLVV